MALPHCSHITRKRGVYYYRRRLPGSGPVYLIDELPPLQVERLGDRR